MNKRRRCEMILIALIVISSLLGSFAAVVFADDDSEEILLRALAKRQNAGEASAEMAAGLDLAEGQARQLLTLLDESAALHIEAYEQQARLMPEMIEVFTEFAREDSLNQGFSPDVERRTARISHEAKETREAFIEQIIALEEQAAAVLTDMQLAYARSFKPGKAAKEREAKTHRRGRRADHGKRERHHHQGQDSPLAKARRELAALNQQLHPRLGPIGQYLLHPTAAESLCRIISSQPNQNLREAVKVYERGTDSYPLSRCDRDKAKVAKLRTEINNWNLINGLHLGRDQIQEIVRLCEVYESQRGAADGKPIRGKAKRNRSERRATVVELERAVEQVMNPGQLAVLADYKACLLPPKDLKNPVRAGQANDTSHYERWLSRARKMPRWRLRRMIGRVLDKEAGHFGELSSDERGERVGLIMDVVQEAAEMSDVDFELNKADLAERIAPRDQPQELKQKIEALARQESLPGKISRFMLKPQFIRQLRYRNGHLAGAVQSEQADLINGPQASDG